MQILIAAACLVWIALFSVSFVNLSGLAVSNGWLMAVALVFAAAAWVLVMVREIRDAVELPDPFESGDLSDSERAQLERAPASAVFHGDRWTSAESPARRRPRKARSARVESVSQPASSDFFHPDV